MKPIVTVAFFLAFSICLIGQHRSKLTLEEAYQLLENRYPVLKNGAILNELYQKDLALLEKSKLPEIYLKADGQIQSESVSLKTDSPTPLPFEIDRPLYSARTYAEARYTILDGGVNDVQSRLKAVQLKAEQQKIEVDRFALRERINQVFVNTHLLQEQLKVFDISLSDVVERKKSVEAAVEYGVILESELIQLKVKELEIAAQKSNLEFKLTGLQNSLADLLDIQLTKDVEFILPSLDITAQIPDLVRPEQALFQIKKEVILAQSDMLDIAKKPKLGAFAQAGVGYPNPLNLLDSDIAPYGILGLQFSWELTDWKKSDIEKEKLVLQGKQLQNAKESFDFNLNSKEASYKAEIARLQNQIREQFKIADLQAEILKQLAAQLDGGVITSADYIVQINAELRTRQNIAIYQAEILKTQLEFWNERGAL